MSDISSQPFTEKLFRLDGRVTLITGASRGIGYGVALGFATLGCRAVVITSRHKEEIEASANSIRAALEETHPSNSCQIVPLQQDVSDDSSNKRVCVCDACVRAYVCMYVCECVFWISLDDLVTICWVIS